jgi:tetratricopeptide (TPR) repeat protein
MARRADASGAATTLTSAAALPHWNAMIDAVFRHAAAAPQHLAATLTADPTFALGHAVKGLMLLTMARAELKPEARRHLELAEVCASAEPVTARERCYIAALAAWLDDQPAQAAAALDLALGHDHNDALAAKLSHAIRFMMGDFAGLHVAARRHRTLHGPGKPYSGFILGMESFAAEELGEFTAAERLGRAALDLNPGDAWARHSVAHVLEMTGRPREGLAWLAAGRAEGGGLNNFSFHLAWHEALFQLELGETGKALSLYDTEIRERRTDDYRDIANAASLLQRLEIAGVRVGDRWEELADVASRRIDDRCLVFADLHYALALAGAGRAGDLDQLAHGLAHAAGEGYNAALSTGQGALLVRGVAAFRAGHYHDAARLLARARPGTPSIGGSNAQRDVVEQMLIEALVRSGDHDLAAHYLSQRLADRGGSNLFAARRLARIGAAKGSPTVGLAAALVRLMPAPVTAH